MHDLRTLFGALKASSLASDWERLLLASPLGDSLVLGHPLGFKVARLNQGCLSLRLHLWSGPKSEQLGFEVHDHMFDLESLVLRGALHQRRFAMIADPQGDCVIYAVTYSSESSSLRKSEDFVRLECLSNERFTAGDLYKVKAGELHATTLDGVESAITLVLTHTVGTRAITVGPRTGPLELFSARKPLSTLSLRQLGFSAALRL